MIQIKNLSVTLENKKIIDDLSINFKPGINIIVGENGSGKSTLLKAIEGLYEYQSGEIFLNSKNIKEVKRIERAKTISYLPQVRPIPAIDGLLLIEHGRFPYHSFSKSKNEDDEKAILEAIKFTKVENFVNKKLSSLSGGERQKIYIAAMLSQTTPIMLLDEPTTYLDLHNQIEILDMLRMMKNKTIVIVLHDLLQAFSYGDYVAVIHQGKVVLEGTPNRIYNSKKIKDIFSCELKLEDDKKSLYKFKILK